MQRKTCYKCQKNLSIESFSKNKGRKDGRNSQCKECQKKYKDLHYINNKRMYKDKAKRHDKKIRTWWYEYKLKLKCSQCNFAHPAAIDFHHIGDKEINLSQAVHDGWGKERILAEVEKCQVLCSNCHRILHWNERNT